MEACQVQGGAGTILLLCLGGWGCAQAGGVAAVEEVVVGAFSSVWPGSRVTCHQPEKTWLHSGLLLPLSPALRQSVRERVFILLLSSVTQWSERPSAFVPLPSSFTGVSKIFVCFLTCVWFSWLVYCLSY